MLLVLTGTSDATANYLVGRLAEHGLDLVRLDTDRVPSEVQFEMGSGRSTLRLGGSPLSPDRIANVWYRRPEPIRVAGDQAGDAAHAALEWSEALEGWLAQIPQPRWMNHPALNAMASHKIEQLSRARSLGLSVPETIVTQHGARLREFWDRCNGAVVVKPLASGFIERDGQDDSEIFTSQIRPEDLNQDAVLALVPTMFQERVAKTADVRICVVDQDLSAVALRRLEADGTQRLDIRRDNMRDVSYCAISPPAEVRERILSLVRAYSLRFAAIDMAIDAAGDWVFFELNPNGQWAWLDIVAGQSIWQLFARSFTE